jgi:hypothetical protein
MFRPSLLPTIASIHALADKSTTGAKDLNRLSPVYLILIVQSVLTARDRFAEARLARVIPKSDVRPVEDYYGAYENFSDSAV